MSNTTAFMIIFFLNTILISAIGYKIYTISEAQQLKQQKMMRQCLKDGRKEYECRSLVYKSDSGDVIIMPMF